MKMYVIRTNNGLLELRQYRFAGQSHPHDVCAIAHDVTEMQAMLATYNLWTNDVDYSRVENERIK
jgi:hypothetical protein